MTEQAKDNKYLRLATYFLVAVLVMQLLGYFIGPGEQKEDGAEVTPISFETTKKSYSIGSIVELEIANNTDKDLRLAYSCPDAPLTVLNTGVTPAQIVDAAPALDCENIDDLRVDSFVLPANKKRVLNYDYWSSTLFSELGRYKFTAQLTVDGEQFQTSSNEFTIESRGIFRSIWFFGLYQPFYNLLVWLITILPSSSLAAGIILLTIIVRLILLIPSHKALRAQKRLQEVQPELERLREKYKNDQQKLAQETMKIWKNNKVNPLGSCLPLLMQFPLLLALFYVVRNGINVSTAFVLYEPLANFDYSQLDTVFLEILPLTKNNLIVLPLIVGGLQFIQMKLSFAKAKKNKPDTKKIAGMPDMASAQNLMVYFLPAMIAVFTASVPAGVGLYWGTSTLFAIGQQLMINREGGTANGGKEIIEAETVK